MDLKLSGKTALVTGSTAGIGFAIASALVDENADVAVNGRSEERVNQAVQKLQSRKRAGKVTGFALDLSRAENVSLLTEKLPEVDILVNNLGIFEPKPFPEITDSDWERFFNVNVMSGVRLSRHYLPPMLKKNWGRIIFISSESGLNIPSEMIHYGMTKTAQLAIARGLAETTAGTNVTVNAVLPGPTLSEGVGTFVQDLAKSQGSDLSEVEKQSFQTVRPSSLIQRFAEPEEVASMVAYLSSPLASATNGAAVRVDGGVVRSIA
jgi:hypothetical protein